MNTITLRVRIDRFEKFASDKGSPILRGVMSFRFYDERTFKTRPIVFTAFGQSALTIEQAGIGGIHVIQGRLDIFPPSQDNVNHQMMVTIDRACPETATAANVPTETVPVLSVPVAPVPEPPATVPSVTVQPRVPVGAGVAASNGAVQKELDDDIPF
jgi:hypothetical protein